jgi:signal transduction histidine kinase
MMSSSAPVNRRLFLLVAAIIIPLAAMAGGGLLFLWNQQRTQVERAGIEITRALSTAVDAELNRALAGLQGIAVGPALDIGDLQRYHRVMQRLLEQRPDWITITLADPHGSQLLNARRAYNQKLPGVLDPATLQLVVKSRQPVIGALTKGGGGEIAVPVRIPVMRDGAVRFVLTAAVKPAAFTDVLERQRVPTDWVVSVFDSHNQRVARSRQHAQFLGQPPAPSLAELMARSGDEGSGVTRALEGDHVYAAYSRSRTTGWTVAIGIPAATVEAGAWRSLAAYGGGLVLSTALAIAAALGMGRMLLGHARKARAEADALAAVATAVNAALDVPRVLQTVADAVRRVTASDLVRIALPDGDDGALVYRYLSGTRVQGYDKHRILPGSGFVGRVARTRRPYRTDDAPNDPHVEPTFGIDFIRAEGVRTVLAVPILDGGGVQGAIYTARRDPIPFSDEDELACTHLAAHAAIALRNAALFRREQAAREQAEEASRAKDVFLAMLGHELRNPLGAIGNATQLLEHADNAGYAKGVIRRQVAHLSRMTDDLLDAARAMTGKIVLQRSPMDLAHAAREAIEVLNKSARTAGQRLVQSLQPAWVLADPVRIEQIVTNLVLNAVKYSAAEGTIRIIVRREESEAVLRVADDGIGMPAELLPRVFDAFVQGEHDLARARGGLGLGLTLVRRLAELHGGSASAASAGRGRGSEFTVRLPAIEAVSAVGAGTAAPPSLAPRDILIVEDNADAGDSLRRLLELAGHRVRLAADGVAGLQALRERMPDVALIDVGLPLMDGYEVARQARASLDGKPAPLLVAVTGYGLPEDRERALAAGFDAHLVKPVDPGALEALLARKV